VGRREGVQVAPVLVDVAAQVDEVAMAGLQVRLALLRQPAEVCAHCRKPRRPEAAA
jgi:hypothetical protein